MKKLKTIMLLLAFALTGGCGDGGGNGPGNDTPDPPEESGAIRYNWPEEAPQAVSYQAWLDGESYYVYPIPVTTQRPGGLGEPFKAEVISFGIEGPVQVEIRPLFRATRVKIRPESAGITHTFENNRLRFTLDKPVMLSVEFDDDITKPLLVFANEPETDVPDPEDDNVMFYKEATIHDMNHGRLAIGAGQTVYVAPGAIVKGAFYTFNTDGVRIMGRGIVSGEEMSGQTGDNWRPCEMNKATNLLVEGITFVDSKNWTMPLMGCDGVDIRGIRIISNTGFEDGIDIVGSRNVTVEKSFIRTKDDCIALKAGIDYFAGYYSEEDVENITVRDCVIWNGAHGNALEIGFETRTDNIRNITFENLDLIHVENPGGMDEGTFTIHNGERAVVDNVLYKNIRVEDPQRMLIDFKVLDSEYSREKTRGKIKNVRFENIRVTSERGRLHSAIFGFDHTDNSADPAHNMENVSFKDFYLNGTRMTGYASDPLDNQLTIYTFNASNITFE